MSSQDEVSADDRKKRAAIEINGDGADGQTPGDGGGDRVSSQRQAKDDPASAPESGDKPDAR
jgi:hypothetical protein